MTSNDDKTVYITLTNCKANTEDTNAESSGISTITKQTLDALYERIRIDQKTANFTSDGYDSKEAFASPSAQRHLKACSLLLDISTGHAAHLTINTLSHLNIPVESYHKLLGTLSLVTAVRDYHLEQRLHRLKALSEVLRIDQDSDREHGHYTACKDFLDGLLGGGMKQVFRSLLQRATGTDWTILQSTRVFELQQVLHLSQSTCSKLLTGFKQAEVIQRLHERHEALEALIALLFKRFSNTDTLTQEFLLELLQAMHTIQFFTEYQHQMDDYRQLMLVHRNRNKKMNTHIQDEDYDYDYGEEEEPGSNLRYHDTFCKRLPKLAALLCVEALGLWQQQCQESQQQQQPHDISSSIRALLVEQANAVAARRANAYTKHSITEYSDAVEARVEKPEALVLLGFGLQMRMLHLSTSSSNTTTANTNTNAVVEEEENRKLADDLLECANDSGAFSYLNALLSEMVDMHRTHDTNNNNSNNNSNHQQQEYHYRSDNIVMYASIAREVLSATIQVMNITNSSSNAGDVAMFCELAEKLHRNQEALCAPFWSYWEGAYCRRTAGTAAAVSKQLEYDEGTGYPIHHHHRAHTKDAEDEEEEEEDDGGGDGGDIRPICQLLDVAYRLAVAATNGNMNHHPNQSMSELQHALTQMTPLLKLTSGLTCNEETAICALTAVPEEVVSYALSCALRCLIHAESRSGSMSSSSSSRALAVYGGTSSGQARAAAGGGGDVVKGLALSVLEFVTQLASRYVA